MPKKQRVSHAKAVREISAIIADHLAGLPVEERNARLMAFKKVIAKGGRAGMNVAPAFKPASSHLCPLTSRI